jgi:hypothetical protein
MVHCPLIMVEIQFMTDKSQYLSFFIYLFNMTTYDFLLKLLTFVWSGPMLHHQKVYIQ